MNLVNQSIRHKSFGLGTVAEHSESYIKIVFSVGEKQFQFPEAFEKFLYCDDEGMQCEVLALLQEKKEQERVRESEKKIEIERLSKLHTAVNRENIKKQKSYPKENIAFKCNYCNGGESDDCVGYKCACTDEMINYNIEVAQHKWCCSEESPCNQYYNGIIERRELDAYAYAEDDGFVCYESQMLRNWTAFAGFVLTGDNKEKPMKLNKVQVNSLAVLTTREPYAAEKERFIFGVFLVDEAYEGDNREEGYVTTTSKYKISLSLDEAKQMLFWNYYHNENAPEKTAWGQGLHRYISDIQAASILYDIVAVKAGTEDEALAKEFLEYFCKINSIDSDALPVLEGALQR